MDISYITKDIMTDKYGDIILDHGDIKTSQTYQDIAKVNSMHRVMSAYKDMKKYPLYGAALSEFIGKKIDDSLLKSIENRVKKCLTEDRFLSESDLDVIIISEQNTVFLKVSISRGFYKDTPTEFNMSFDIIGGEVYVF